MLSSFLFTVVPNIVKSSVLVLALSCLFLVSSFPLSSSCEYCKYCNMHPYLASIHLELALYHFIYNVNLKDCNSFFFRGLLSNFLVPYDLLSAFTRTCLLFLFPKNLECVYLSSFKGDSSEPTELRTTGAFWGAS